MSKETYYLIIDGKRKARVVTRYPDLNAAETAIRVTVEFPPERRITAEVALTLQEHVVSVDGVEMIPLAEIVTLVEVPSDG